MDHPQLSAIKRHPVVVVEHSANTPQTGITDNTPSGQYAITREYIGFQQQTPGTIINHVDIGGFYKNNTPITDSFVSFGGSFQFPEYGMVEFGAFVLDEVIDQSGTVHITVGFAPRNPGVAYVTREPHGTFKRP